jgi:signal transduction histidine kinase
MPETVWFRSLYWRIAIGFVAMLAVVLALQTTLFLYMTGRFAASSRTPQQLADEIARELSDTLTEHPALDLDRHVRERYEDMKQAFVVILRDGRRTANRPGVLPPGFGGGLRRGGPPPFSDNPGQRGDGPARLESLPGEHGPPPDFVRRRGGRGGPGAPSISPIVVNSAQVGHVAVPSGPPPMEVALRELGPTLTWSGLALLGIGSMTVALVIFGPARKRLRSLETAARALGQGEIGVRADDRGGDEVSTLARTFNGMAAELQARSSALAASDRARRQLLADVSHELMTPLTAIRGYTETLAMPNLTVDPPTRARYFDIVDKETYKLEAIIGDLLDLAKLDDGGGTLTIERLAVEDLFDRIAERHEPALRARNITLEQEVPEDLELDADLQRLEQALQNVASNAVRHTPDGGRVQLHAEPLDSQVRITIRDSGPGIPPEHLPHIFDRFYKADPARPTAAASGSGLGLSIVRAIVERHGGTVTAGNAPDGGAVFEFLLPRRQPTANL